MQIIIDNNKELIDEIWKKVDRKLSVVAVKSRDKLPYTTKEGIHNNMATTELVDSWTNGFWGGMMWLMYNATKNETYRDTARKSEELLDKALEKSEKLHHDVGFMWHLTSGANYRLTGDLKAKNTDLITAALLVSRYNVNGGFIRAWNWEGTEGLSIIDTMMNLPLLYWASKELNDDNMKNIAIRHADMVLRDHIRPDSSVRHIVEHNVINGDIVKVHGGQGYDENSCWTRGLAWAIYGMVLSYIHTEEEKYFETAIKCADYYIENIKPYEYLTPLDFNAPKEPLYYDSTAGVITACGLLEIAKFTSEEKASLYTETAINILKATDEHFCNYEDNEDSIVQMGSERYPHESMEGIHIPIIYGDFFFVEALCKLRGSEFLIW